MTTPFRFLVQDISYRSKRNAWEIYKVSLSNTKGIHVATVYDKDSLNLFLRAPALDQLNNDRRKMGIDTDYDTSRDTLRERDYKHGLPAKLSHALVSLFRRTK